MGFRISQGGTLHEGDADTTLDVGGTLKLGGTAVTATAAQINNASNMQGGTLTFTPAAGGANVAEVTVTVKDGAGAAVAQVFNLDLWLTDAASGAGLTATTASGTVTAKAASGIVVDTYTAKKALYVQTLATGVFVLEITDTAKTGFRIAGVCPLTGKTVVSSALVTGNYG